MTSRRKLLAITILVAVAALAGVLAYSLSSRSQTGCSIGQSVGSDSRSQTFLIVASITGFNGSADHGVPAACWPVIRVPQGTLVNITVTNIDKQAHGFNIAHYYDDGIVTVAPSQTINVSFVANETGTFKIYCSIFCTIHWAMQSGELVVT